MSRFNMPPGVSTNDIPGNEPEGAMVLYIVSLYDEDNQDYAILGVFSSKEKAEGIIPEGLSESQREQFGIEELTLDEINPGVIFFELGEDSGPPQSEREITPNEKEV